MNRPVQMRACLNVNRDQIGAGFNKILQISIGILNHQVNVDHRLHFIGERSQGADDDGPHGDVRNEMAVHHIDVDPFSARFECRAGFFLQLREVGSQN